MKNYQEKVLKRVEEAAEYFESILQVKFTKDIKKTFAVYFQEKLLKSLSTILHNSKN